MQKSILSMQSENILREAPLITRIEIEDNKDVLLPDIIKS